MNFHGRLKIALENIAQIPAVGFAPIEHELYSEEINTDRRPKISVGLT
jgi:hypothetical protein